MMDNKLEEQIKKRITCGHCNSNNWADGVKLVYEGIEYTGAEHSQGAIFECYVCSSCLKLVVFFTSKDYNKQGKLMQKHIENNKRLYPFFITPKKLSKDIPAEYKKDYAEIEKLTQVSSKASAIMCRYLIEKLLRNQCMLNNNLDKMIENFALKYNLKTSDRLVKGMHLIRKAGNGVIHNSTSNLTQNTMKVTTESCNEFLEILEELFIFVFVNDKKAKKRDAIANEEFTK